MSAAAQLDGSPVPREPRVAGRALLAFLAAFAVYGGTALAFGHTHPKPVYFDSLADAFLHGRLHLEAPPGTHDLTPLEGRWYVPFPPLPALLLLPWMALFGLQAVNGVVFGALLGGLNVAFVFCMVEQLARRGWIALTPRERIWITALFAFGTVHWYVAAEGTVWFLGQVAAVLFAAIATWLAMVKSSGWLSGTALALAMLARPNVAFTWPLLAGCAAMRRTQAGLLDRRRWLLWTASSLAPMLASAALLMTYNYARFRDPLDFGYARQNVETGLLGDLHTHGQFSLHHVPRNVRWMLLAPPRLERDSLLPRPDDRGMSVLLTTPALIFTAWARRRDALTRGAWWSVLLLLAPLLLYYNTGWRQFGYRFLLDLIVPLVVLVAIGISTRRMRFQQASPLGASSAEGQSAAMSTARWFPHGWIVASIIVNALGVAWWFTRPEN